MKHLLSIDDLSTDEILQWAACKWGIDEDIVRAQAAKETYWTQDHLGDFGTDPARCVPGPGYAPRSRPRARRCSGGRFPARPAVAPPAGRGC